MIRILLVDDHVILRAGLKAIVSELNNCEIAGEARNGKHALEFLKNESVDIVMTDIQMPEMDGFECTRNITEKYPDTKVIAVTMYNDSESVHRMLDAGVSGYILKDSSACIISEAIESVHSGDRYIGKEMNNSIHSGLEKDDLYLNLSQREIDVLRLIIDEKSNGEIADELFISIRTVDAHRRNLLKKTGSKNTVGLTKYALRHQLV